MSECSCSFLAALLGGGGWGWRWWWWGVGSGPQPQCGGGGTLSLVLTLKWLLSSVELGVYVEAALWRSAGRLWPATSAGRQRHPPVARLLSLRVPSTHRRVDCSSSPENTAEEEFFVSGTAVASTRTAPGPAQVVLSSFSLRFPEPCVLIRPPADTRFINVSVVTLSKLRDSRRLNDSSMVKTPFEWLICVLVTCTRSSASPQIKTWTGRSSTIP